VLKRIASALGPQVDTPGGVEVPTAARGHISLTLLRRVWKRLREHRLAIVSATAGDGILADVAQRFAVRMGVRKLVLIDEAGGLASESGLVSFMDGAMLDELLRQGEAEWAGIGHRRPLLEAVRAALRGGVASVNVVDLSGVARELFTYEGAGTLFTLEDYCRVERLRVDDFLEVEKLLERGVQEGYLRRRDARETAELLLSGYGATIGSGHLAGVCGLATEPYRSERVGEIVGLYTITRFKGEGVGGKLLARVLDDARQQGLRYVFACTTHERARTFFQRHGFLRARPTDVPRRKWRTYSAARRRKLTIHKLEMANAELEDDGNRSATLPPATERSRGMTRAHAR
jgi:amino-acid N-acetyltransferase